MSEDLKNASSQSSSSTMGKSKIQWFLLDSTHSFMLWLDSCGNAYCGNFNCWLGVFVLPPRFPWECLYFHRDARCSCLFMWTIFCWLVVKKRLAPMRRNVRKRTDVEDPTPLLDQVYSGRVPPISHPIWALLQGSELCASWDIISTELVIWTRHDVLPDCDCHRIPSRNRLHASGCFACCRV